MNCLFSIQYKLNAIYYVKILLIFFKKILSETDNC